MGDHAEDLEMRELDCSQYELKELRELRDSVNHMRKLFK